MSKVKIIARPMNGNMKQDCFAFINNNRGCWCKALDDIYCSFGEGCSFYKTFDEEKELREKTTRKV